MVGYFFRAGRSAKTRFQSGGHAVDSPALDPDRARGGVSAAQIIQNGTANPQYCVGAEGQSATQVKAVERLHQAERAGADQLAQLDRRNPPGNAPSHVMHQAEVTNEKLGPSIGISGAAVTSPEGFRSV